jgi:hypothetical protein
MGDEYPTMAAEEDHLRAQALDRLKRKRDFLNHVLVFGARLCVAVGRLRGHGRRLPVAAHLDAPVGVGVVGHGFDAYRQPFGDEQSTRTWSSCGAADSDERRISSRADALADPAEVDRRLARPVRSQRGHGEPGIRRCRS